MAKQKEVEQAVEPIFSKTQVLNAKKYQDRKDVLSTLLVDGKTYTLENVDKLIENFMKGQVK
jgi:hypothetical protein